MSKTAKTRDGWVTFECPACGGMHGMPVEGPKAWKWNGSLDNPTLTPSLKIEWGYGDPPKHNCCHLNITNGSAFFHGDCTHALRGNHPLPELEA